MDDEINEREIKGFSADFWDGCFCFRSSLIMCPHFSSELPVRIQHGPRLRCAEHTNAALQFEVGAQLVSSGRSCTWGRWFVAIGTPEQLLSTIEIDYLALLRGPPEG